MRGDFYEFDDLKREVIDTGLCTHCGLCIEACPVDVIGTGPADEGSLPVLVDDCPACNICVEICPGKTVDFQALREQSERNGERFSDHLGHYRSIYLGHATDSHVRGSGSSGGVITALLLHAKRTGKVEGALVLSEEEDTPWEFRSHIAETEEDILKAAQSKYVIPARMGTAGLVDYRKPLAYVGLPCQIHGLKKLEAIRPSWSSNIAYTIGLYCGDTLYFSATAALFKRFGIQNYSQIASVRYREGDWPGRFEVELKDGRVYGISKYTFNYLSFLYDVDRCHLCTDISAEFADISVGDGWKYEGQSAGGWSIIVTRNEKGDRLLQEAVASGDLNVEPVALEDAVAMHAHSLDNKKVGSLLRIEARGLRGRPVPHYNLPIPKTTRSRRIGERAVAIMLKVLRSPVSRLFLNHLPLFWLEKLLFRIREIWKWWSRRNLEEAIQTTETATVPKAVVHKEVA